MKNRVCWSNCPTAKMVKSQRRGYRCIKMFNKGHIDSQIKLCERQKEKETERQLLREGERVRKEKGVAMAFLEGAIPMSLRFLLSGSHPFRWSCHLFLCWKVFLSSQRRHWDHAGFEAIVYRGAGDDAHSVRDTKWRLNLSLCPIAFVCMNS